MKIKVQKAQHNKLMFAKDNKKTTTSLSVFKNRFTTHKILQQTFTWGGGGCFGGSAGGEGF